MGEDHGTNQGTGERVTTPHDPVSVDRGTLGESRYYAAAGRGGSAQPCSPRARATVSAATAKAVTVLHAAARREALALGAKAACIRRGSVYQYVHPGGTSITCSECGKNAKESRLSQSEFCCVGCGYTANADANAAENIRTRGLARVRASARRHIERRKKKRAESTVRSTEPGPGNGGAAGGNSATAPYANGTGRCRESRCRGPG